MGGWPLKIVPFVGLVKPENRYAPSRSRVTTELEQFSTPKCVTSGVPRERTLAIRPSRAWLVCTHRHSRSHLFSSHPPRSGLLVRRLAGTRLRHPGSEGCLPTHYFHLWETG